MSKKRSDTDHKKRPVSSDDNGGWKKVRHNDRPRNRAREIFESFQRFSDNDDD